MRRTHPPCQPGRRAASDRRLTRSSGLGALTPPDGRQGAVAPVEANHSGDNDVVLVNRP